MAEAMTMIEIKRAVLHILDLGSGVPVYGDKELDREMFGYLQKHLEKAWKDAAAHNSAIGEVNPIRRRLEAYRDGEDVFVALSRELAQKLYQDLAACGEEQAVDLVAADLLACGERQFCLLLCPNQLGYTHKVHYEADQISNQIVPHRAILPNPSQKVASFAFIDMTAWTVRFADKKRVLDGEEVFLLPERILNCTMPASSRETVKKLHTIVRKVAEEYGENSAQAVSRAKSYLMEHGGQEGRIRPAEVGQAAFPEHRGMQASYQEQVLLASLPQEAPIERDYAVRANRCHKIRTDIGIEITVPSDFFNDPEYIEFCSNEDGTISIRIKRIGKIFNR